MKILTRYILGEFLKIFSLTLAAFISLYFIIDAFENMGKLIESHAQLGDTAEFFLYKIPFIFYQVTPVAILMATLISLGIFVKYKEVTAAFAGGISLMRLTMPLFAAALVVSGLNFMLNESVIPSANQRVADIKQAMDGASKKTQFAQESVWFRDNTDIYSINYIEPEKGVLKGLTIYKMDNGFNIAQRIDANRVSWIDGRWIVEEGRLSRFQDGRLIDESKMTKEIIPLNEKPEDLKNIERLADEMNIKELWRYISKLKKEGYTAPRYVVDLHSKISFPLVSIIMVMIGIPFALKSGRHGGIAVGVGISVIIGFSYWVVFAIGVSLGYNGLIPPLLAAWLANMIFAGLGVLMFTYVRQ